MMIFNTDITASAVAAVSSAALVRLIAARLELLLLLLPLLLLQVYDSTPRQNSTTRA